MSELSTQVRPAPDVPPEIDQQYRRMEWMLYRLRRAHLQAGPAEPAAALASAGARCKPAYCRSWLTQGELAASASCTQAG